MARMPCSAKCPTVSRIDRISLALTACLALALPTAATGQPAQQVNAAEERAAAGHLYSPDFMDAELKRKLDSIMSALVKEHDSCNRAAFDHDLRNLEALAQIAQGAAQTEEGKLRSALVGRFPITPGGFAISPGAISYHLKDPSQLVDEEVQRQRDDEKTSYGRAFSIMLAMNRNYLWALAWRWNHCKDTTAAVQPPAAPPSEDSQITAADVDRVLRSIQERNRSERPREAQQKPTGPLHGRIQEAQLRFQAEQLDCPPNDIEFYRRLKDDAWRHLQATDRSKNRAEFESALADHYEAEAVFNKAYEACKLRPGKAVAGADNGYGKIEDIPTEPAPPGVGPNLPLGGPVPYPLLKSPFATPQFILRIPGQPNQNGDQPQQPPERKQRQQKQPTEGQQQGNSRG